MKSRRFIWVVVFALVMAGLLAGGVWYWTQPQGPSQDLPRSGLLVPATAQDIFTRIKALNRPVVLVNFWASWCGPCKAEFPSLMEAKEKFAHDGLGVVLVSMDDPSNFQAAQTFLREEHVHFQSFYRGNRPLTMITKFFPHWGGAIPTTVLMNSHLELLDAWEGGTSLKEFTQRISRQLKGT